MTLYWLQSLVAVKVRPSRDGFAAVDSVCIPSCPSVVTRNYGSRRPLAEAVDCLTLCVPRFSSESDIVSELPMGWVDPWVGSTIAKVLKIWKDYVNAFKARLDKIWFHQAVKFDFTADLSGTGNR